AIRRWPYPRWGVEFRSAAADPGLRRPRARGCLAGPGGQGRHQEPAFGRERAANPSLPRRRARRSALGPAAPPAPARDAASPPIADPGGLTAARVRTAD